jgi:hypothetical protein
VQTSKIVKAGLLAARLIRNSPALSALDVFLDEKGLFDVRFRRHRKSARDARWQKFLGDSRVVVRKFFTGWRGLRNGAA